MPRPYNLKTKRDAAFICDTLASNKGMTFAEVVVGLGIKPSSTGPQLAGNAFKAVSDFLSKHTVPWTDIWSEAAELIRSGWRLDEPLERIAPSNTEASDAILKEVYSPDVVTQMASAPHPFLAGLPAIVRADCPAFYGIERTVGVPLPEQVQTPMEDTIELACSRVLGESTVEQGYDTVFPIDEPRVEAAGNTVIDNTDDGTFGIADYKEAAPVRESELSSEYLVPNDTSEAGMLYGDSPDGETEADAE